MMPSSPISFPLNTEDNVPQSHHVRKISRFLDGLENPSLLFIDRYFLQIKSSFEEFWILKSHNNNIYLDQFRSLNRYLMATKKVEETYCEIMEGYGISLLITGPSTKIIRRIGTQFVAGSGLSYGKAEFGIQTYLSNKHTPDQRAGIVCSAWVIPLPNETKKHTINRLNKILDLKIRTTLFPQLSIRVFSAPTQFISKRKKTPEGYFDSYYYLGDFGDGFSSVKSSIYSDQETVFIPMMGGDFSIERKIPIYKGLMGGNLFVHFDEKFSAWRVQEKIRKMMTEHSNVAQIWELIACGSKLGFNNLTDGEISQEEKMRMKYNISTQLVLCPSIRDLIEESKIGKNTCCVIEIVINSFELHMMREALKELLKLLQKESGVLKISAGNYGGKLGKDKIYL